MGIVLTGCFTKGRSYTAFSVFDGFGIVGGFSIGLASRCQRLTELWLLHSLLCLRRTSHYVVPGFVRRVWKTEG